MATRNFIKREFEPIKAKPQPQAATGSAATGAPGAPNTPKRVFKKVKKLSILTATDCEITELHSEATWDEWKNSEFLRNFESACSNTEPMPLSADANAPMLAKHEFDDLLIAAEQKKPPTRLK